IRYFIYSLEWEQGQEFTGANTGHEPPGWMPHGHAGHFPQQTAPDRA
ncbi:16417_t:CDS:1, partial [Acaulospora colombiana]